MSCIIYIVQSVSWL